MYRVKSLKPFDPLPVVIVEAMENNPYNHEGKLKKGCRIYCGICGQIMGVAKHNLVLPFPQQLFFNSLENREFNVDKEEGEKRWFSHKDHGGYLPGGCMLFWSLENFWKSRDHFLRVKAGKDLLNTINPHEDGSTE